MKISSEDERAIRRLAEDPKIYETLCKGIAPDVYGHETVKEAIVLQLFGGSPKQLYGKYTERENIHILLIGEPYCIDKSLLLLSATKIAPNGIYIMGHWATDRWFAAQARTYKPSKKKQVIEVGELALASNGITGIDFLEKLCCKSRETLQEVIEHQGFSKSEDGKVIRVKASTGILAAANPTFSPFNMLENLIDQLIIPPSLAYKFDLIFYVRRILDYEKDRKGVMDMLKMHQLAETKTRDLAMGKKPKKEKVFVMPEAKPGLLTKYIAYARKRVFPVMSNENIKTLCALYFDLRDNEIRKGNGCLSMGFLETIIMLSEASARTRLSNIVDALDVKRAMRIFKASLRDMNVL